MRLIRAFLICLLPGLLAANLFAAGEEKHVVLVVWDGMRPDFISAENTPTLWQLAQRGVTFKNHHPVYVSSTEVNGTAIATGMYPEQSGIIGNTEYRPAINPTKKIAMEELANVRKGDEVMDNHYLAFPTVAEILHKKKIRTVIAGAKDVALLHDRAARSDSAPSTTLFAGKSEPESFAKKAVELLGAFPPDNAASNRDNWTTRTLTELLWEQEVPKFSVLWLSQPDNLQHKSGPGSQAALGAIKNSDDNLGRVVDFLKKRNLLEKTDIIVVSDHGFSTIEKVADVPKALNEAGLPALREYPAKGGHEGDILVLGIGGTAFLYVPGHDAATIEKAVRVLQAQPFCGVVFTKKALPGTFPLEAAKINSATAPDIAMAMRWRADKSSNGTPGLIYSEGAERGPGGGNHATLDPFDMHNIGFAAGPDFRAGVLSYLPSGNVDIAPTVLWILGVKQKMSGRVLREALITSGSAKFTFEPHHLEATAKLENAVWHQYLDYSEVDGVRYLDEGNGGQDGKQ